MNTHSHDFVMVDMRGLKAALVARAQAQRVSVSVLVRGAVARELGFAMAAADQQASSARASSSAACVRLSIRMTPEEAEQLAVGARAACLPRGAYLVGLIAGLPVLTAGGSRTDHIAALITSSAELSTLSRNIQHLASLLRQGNVEPARQYREMLDTLSGDVRGHLMLAAFWPTCGRARRCPPVKACWIVTDDGSRSLECRMRRVPASGVAMYGTLHSIAVRAATAGCADGASFPASWTCPLPPSRIFEVWVDLGLIPMAHASHMRYNVSQFLNEELVMPATSMVHVRVDEHLKTQATETLAMMGLSVSDAVRVFLTRVVAEQQLPFALKAPNAETRAAMKEARTISKARFASARTLLVDLEKGAKR